MKKKDNAALADAFRKLSSAAAEIAEALDSTAKKSEPAETPEAEAKTGTEPTADTTAESAKTKADISESNISFEDIRTVLASKAGEGYRAEVKEILSRHNASCLSDLEPHPEDFPAILEEAEAIGNE